MTRLAKVCGACVAVQYHPVHSHLSSVDREVLLPLEKGVLTNNLGIALIVVCTKVRVTSFLHAVAVLLVLPVQTVSLLCWCSLG